MSKRIELTKFPKRADALSVLIVFAHIILVVAPLYIAAYCGPGLSWIALWLWFGVLMNGLLNLMHECAHYHTFRARRGSDFLGRWLLGPLAVANFDAYRSRHWQHHLHLGTDEDTKDAYRVDIRREKLFWFLFRCLVLSEAIRKFRHQTVNVQPNDKQGSPIWLLRAVVVQELLFVSLLLVAGPVRDRSWPAAFEIAALAYVVVYVYGLASATVFISTLRAIAEHQIESGEESENGGATLRNFARGPFSLLVFGAYGFSEHGTHHREPGLPYYWLTEATRELAVASPELGPRRRYTDELFIIFRSIPFVSPAADVCIAPKEL